MEPPLDQSSTIVCRLCRLPLLSAGGCVTCSEMKRNLAVIGDAPQERIDLGELSGETLQLMRDQLRRLQHYTKAMKIDEQIAHTKTIQDFARGMATFMAEARKVRKEGVSAMRAMSYQEQRALFESWIEYLPPAHRQNVYEGITALLKRLGDLMDQLPAGDEEDDDD
jgi:hypothetical protein